MANWTDQKPQVATADDVVRAWGGGKNGKFFKCYLCGRKFVVGDIWRWVFTSGRGVSNFLTCSTCDGDDVIERYVKMGDEYKTLCRKYWRFARNRGIGSE